jgi:hypothetical protein
MALAAPSTADDRGALIDRLGARNRVVGGLRLVVPLAGVLLFAVLAGQVWLGSLARQYGVSGIGIDRGHLVVETPRYAATMADGSRLALSAREARAAIDNPDTIDLTDAELDYAPAGRAALVATAATALLDSGAQTVDVPGVLDVTGEGGLSGTLHDIHTDIAGNVTRANGAVSLTLAGGITIAADGMVFDGKTWTFDNATVVLPGLPGAAE